MNNNIIEKFQSGGKSTKTLRNFLNRASKTAESALTNLQDYGREKNLPRWITDAFDPNRDLAPYSGKEASGVLPEINMERFNYYPANVDQGHLSHYNFYQYNPVHYTKETPTPVLRQYTEYNQGLISKALNMGLDRYSKDINLHPVSLTTNNKNGIITHNVDVPTYVNPIKNYLHPTNGARRVEATYMPSEGYVYKRKVSSPNGDIQTITRVNEQELPSFKRALEKEGMINFGNKDKLTYSYKLPDGSMDSNKGKVDFIKVPVEPIDVRHISTLRIPGEPFRNNQFLTKTVPATAGAGAAGALGAYVYNLIKDKSEDKSEEK